MILLATRDPSRRAITPWNQHSIAFADQQYRPLAKEFNMGRFSNFSSLITIPHLPAIMRLDHEVLVGVCRYGTKAVPFIMAATIP
jgi:hypothetical protein